MRSALRLAGSLAGPLLLTTLLLSAGAAHAEATGPKAPPAARPAGDDNGRSVARGDDRIVHVCEIRYQDVQSVSLVLPSLMSDAGILTVDRATRTVTIVDHPEFVQRVKDFVAQFDVPPQAVLIRIVLEKAQRQGAAAARGLTAAPTGTDQLASDSTGWTYSPLAETTLEVLERGQATQAVGADGAFEIHVALGAVDMARRAMRFDEIAISRIEASTPTELGPPAAPIRREMFKTALDLQDRVGKVVMATREESSDVALVVRVLGLIRDDGEAR